MLDLCRAISDAKCCSAKLAGAYVGAANTGENTDDALYELLLLNGWIKVLERYEQNPTVPLTTIFTDGNLVLVDNDKLLSFACHSETVCLDADSVNCLKKSDVCFMLEQISKLCDNCKCDC